MLSCVSLYSRGAGPFCWRGRWRWRCVTPANIKMRMVRTPTQSRQAGSTCRYAATHTYRQRNGHEGRACVQGRGQRNRNVGAGKRRREERGHTQRGHTRKRSHKRGRANAATLNEKSTPPADPINSYRADPIMLLKRKRTTSTGGLAADVALARGADVAQARGADVGLPMRLLVFEGDVERAVRLLCICHLPFGAG